MLVMTDQQHKVNCIMRERERESSVLRHHQHSIGYTGDGFYRSKDPTNSIKVLKEETVS